MEIYWLGLFGFLAGFIDSIAGGGGLVQIPAFFVLFPHLSVQNIIGTNRLASTVGTIVAAWNYASKMPLSWKVILPGAIGAATCSYIGVNLQGMLPNHLLKPVIFFLILGVAVFSYMNKTLGQEQGVKFSTRQLPWVILGIGMATGFYNGLIGPGTGTLLMFALVRIVGYHFLNASASAKVLNVVADVSTLFFFIKNDLILFDLVLPLMVCNVAGSWVGSRMAMLRGNTFVRKVFLVVMAGVISRFGWDIAKAWWPLLFG